MYFCCWDVMWIVGQQTEQEVIQLCTQHVSHLFSITSFITACTSQFLFDCHMNHVISCARTTVTLYVAGITEIGMSCTLLLDEAEEEDIQLCIQHGAGTMLVIFSANQELTAYSGEHNDNGDNGTDKKKCKYFHWDREWARQIT